MYTPEQHHRILQGCRQWYEKLATYRDRIHHMRNELYVFAPGQTDREVLMQVEHFHNQFHIQLINLHDLKHEIRHHVAEAERHPEFGHRIPHIQLEEKLQSLLSDFDHLDRDFHGFLKP